MRNCVVPILLICDDEQPLSVELAEWFSAGGWTVHTAVSTADARRHMAENGYPDVLLIEEKLPHEDGSDFLASLLGAQLPDRPSVLALMGSEEFWSANRSERRADLWLPKPFSPTEANAQFMRALEAAAISKSRR